MAVVAASLAAGGTASADHGGDWNCPDFPFQEDAQEHMDRHAGDPDGLDGDPPNGVACENLRRRGTRPVGSSPATFTPANVAPGETVTMSGSGFEIYSPVLIRSGNAVFSKAQADARGFFRAEIVIPVSAPTGFHAYTAIGRSTPDDPHQVTGTVAVGQVPTSTTTATGTTVASSTTRPAPVATTAPPVATTAPSGGLPRTGMSRQITVSLLLLAVGLLALGAWLVEHFRWTLPVSTDSWRRGEAPRASR